MGFKVFWNTKWISTYRYPIGTSTGPTEFIVIPHLCTLPLEVLWWMIPPNQEAKNLAVIYDFCNRLKKVTAPQLVYVLIPGVCKCYFYDKDSAGMIKYLEMGRLAGISRWALNTNISILTKEKWRKSDTRIREGDAKMEQQSDVATNYTMPAATRSWKRQGMDSPLEPYASHSEGVGTCQHLDFKATILTSNFWPPNPERICLLF